MRLARIIGACVFPPRLWACSLDICLLGSVVVSGITFTKMVQYFGPVRSTMITAVVPGLSALGAVFFLGEPLHWNLLAGLALVTVGIVFGVPMQAQRASVVAPDLIADGARPTRAKA
ncbi:MAG: EamA family transporter [Polaromonas sp.]|nr:EamA family transporter [Polaromonas sp.]MDP2819446.1 EamA family transporter [Polaromonas sp.]